MFRFHLSPSTLLLLAVLLDTLVVEAGNSQQSVAAFSFRSSIGPARYINPVSLHFSFKQQPEANGQSDDPYKLLGKLKDMGKDGADSKMEQFQKLKQLEARLKKLQEDQMQKEQNYQERIRVVMEEMDKKEKDLLGKVQYFSNQLEQYRFDSQKSLTAAKEASEKKEAQLKEEIRTLRLKVEELEGEYSKAKAFTEELITKRDSLMTELSELKAAYAKEITAWENRYEMEQNERKKEQKRHEELLKQAKEASKKAQQKGASSAEKETAEKLRELYVAQLTESERKIREISAEVEQKAVKVAELESERSSVRKMLTRSMGLVGNRVKNGVKTVLLPRAPKNASSALPTSFATDTNATALAADSNSSSDNVTAGGSPAIG